MAYLEKSYFNTMGSYTDLDLHLQFAWFLERLYIDWLNDQKYIFPTSKSLDNPSC